MFSYIIPFYTLPKWLIAWTTMFYIQHISIICFLVTVLLHKRLPQKITEAFPPIHYQKLTTLNKDKNSAYGRPLHLSRCADSSNKTKTNVFSSYFCVFFVVLVIVVANNVGVVFFVNISLPPYRVSWKSLETKLKIKLNGLFTSYFKNVSFS